MKYYPRLKSRKQSIDLGLAVLDIVRPAGIAIPRHIIADICECSINNICVIEKSAIAKIKNNVGNLSDYLTEESASPNNKNRKAA